MTGPSKNLPPMDITFENMQKIKEFILKHGDAKVFCNMYNDNPHYKFENFHTYLIPDVGQINFNCDPALSDFDQLVIQDYGTDEIYFEIKFNQESIRIIEGDPDKTNQYYLEILDQIGSHSG